MADVELAVQRKQTKHFISEHPETVTFNRGGSREPDGAGGFKVIPGDPIDPQQMRIIQQGGNVASRNIDGEEVQPAYVLIGEWDADIRKGDVWVKDNRNYEVVFVRNVGHPTAYETWAEVVYRG